jgi:hypothetical protein
MRALLPGLLALLLAACGDPVREKAIDALGGEKPGVPAGPLHRGGEPCVLCHDGSGPGSSVFSLAGTVYQTKGAKVPLANALVKFIDQAGNKHQTGTNCAGNFFVMQADYDPAFPVWVKVDFGFQVTPVDPHKPVEIPMDSPIYREGSCAKCHAEQESVESAGHVYLSPVEGVTFPAVPCR